MGTCGPHQGEGLPFQDIRVKWTWDPDVTASVMVFTRGSQKIPGLNFDGLDLDSLNIEGLNFERLNVDALNVDRLNIDDLNVERSIDEKDPTFDRPYVEKSKEYSVFIKKIL
jgi:hypothetical protein